MKKLEFKFTGGDTPVVLVSFYNKYFKEKLEATDADNFDQLDFLTENEAKSVWLGRGMCNEGNPTVAIFEDGNPVKLPENADEVFIYDGEIPPEEGEEEDFFEMSDQKYGTVLTGTANAMVNPHKDDRYFGDIDKYHFASVEKVETHNASGTVTIEVEDDWKWTDFNVIYVDVDSGEGFTQEIYALTDLEQELFGIDYKGKIYEVDSDYEGGFNEWTYYEKDKDGDWSVSFKVTDLMEEKGGDW